MTGFARGIVRATLPPRVRRKLRIAIRELPHRLRDFPADLRDALGGDRPLPPARLRRRVSATSSRREFEEVGRAVAADLLAGFERCREPGVRYPRWLDFGCGAGRVARALVASAEIDALEGMDVAPDLVAWAGRGNPRGAFRTTSPTPPTDVDGGRFDVVVCVSVFTHFDEARGRAWAAELARLLRPGGLLIVSTHGPAIAAAEELTEEQRRRFVERGFLFVPGGGCFNDDVSFHSEAYLRAEWERWFMPVEHRAQGLTGFQDLSVWRRR